MRGTPSGSLLTRSRPGTPDLARAGIALAVGVLVGVLAWSLRPTSLAVPIDVVGYPSFANFNYRPIIWGWRILVWLAPLTAAVCYLLLVRVGPMRPQPSASVVAQQGLPSATQTGDVDYRVSEPARLVAMLGVPALLVAFAVSALSAGPGGGFSVAGVLTGAAYGLVVSGVAWVVARREGSPSFTHALSATSAVLGVLLAPMVMLVASSRTLAVTASRREESWAWLPWWLAVTVAVAGLVVVVIALRRGREAAGLERRVRTLLLGSVATFVAVSSLPGVVGRVEGFDDSQSVVGADLLARGYFPWRDFMFIHGLFEDALRSTLGFEMFEPTLWGAAAFRYALMLPVAYVLLYLLVVWATPRSSLLPAGMVLFAAAGPWLSERWVGQVVGIILLGEVVRRRTWRWTALLTSFLFVEAVLVPEAAFQVIATFVVLLVSDFVRRPASGPWWRKLPTVSVFVATGAVLTVLLAIILALAGALSSFVDYFRYFGPGHFESGTLPLDLVSTRFDWIVIVLIALAVISTWLLVLLRWAHGYELTPLHWCMLASAITAGFYGEKALGRFDVGHSYQSLTVVMPLLVMWVSWLVSTLDARARASSAVRAGWPQPVACLAIAGLVAVHPSTVDKAAHTPGRAQVSVDGARAAEIGYIDPAALDLSLLGEVEEVLDTYAGPDGTVFDFTNSLGYFHYLLGREPATAFVHVSMAVTPLAQQAVIEELEQSRPPVVVFDNTSFGLAAWDGPRPGVRHYEIADYILENWTPVLDADGVLYLARNDLVDDLPRRSDLGVPVYGRDLYFFPPDCDWGYSANYVESRPTGERVVMELSNELGFRTQMVGWAYDTEADEPVSDVLIVSGDRVVGRLPTGGSRPDLPAALGLPGSGNSGFSGALVFTGDHSEGVTLYAVVGDGRAFVISPPAGYAPPTHLRDGSRRIEVGPPGRFVGWADNLDGEPTAVSTADVPAGVDLRDYDVATFEADGGIGWSQMSLTDRLDATGGAAGNNRRVLFNSLPVAGDDLSVRVGSCLQWHGFTGPHLYLSQDDGRPIERIVLSGVAD